MLKMLILAAAFASLLIASTANAGLGWTLEEAQAHWGLPIEGPRKNDLGLTTYDFRAHGYIIAINLDDDNETIISIKYVNEGDRITDDAIEAMLTANASSDVEWKEVFRPDSVREWDATNANGETLFFAVYSEAQTGLGRIDGMLQVSTNKINELINSRRNKDF
jgi:hypothetical protein